MIVYIVQCGDFVKIGRTGNIHTKLTSLRENSPDPVQLLLTTTKYKEHDLTKRFKQYRTVNGWYQFTDEIRAFINQEREESPREHPPPMPYETLAKTLACIKALQAKVGITAYSVETNDILTMFNQQYDTISLPTLYRYIGALKSGDYVRPEKITLKSYTRVHRDASRNIYIEDPDGTPVLPNTLPDFLFFEKGEKILTRYILTEKGKQLLQSENYD